jgi:superfamily II DNA/RNA helicase
MPQVINKLSHEILYQPVIAEITPQSTTVERIEQKVFLIEGSHKRMLLKEILLENDLKTVLVFCKTKRGANQLATYLISNRISVSLIHGNKSQSAREKALQDFRDGKVKVLIATDIASRGIDIVGISHVINFDMPLDPESYVHRIGRTARAGREGIAISFCDTLEIKFLREVEKTIGKKLAIDDSRMFRESNSISRKIGDKNNNKKQENTMTNNTNNQSRNNQSFGRKISSAQNNLAKNNPAFLTSGKPINKIENNLQNSKDLESFEQKILDYKEPETKDFSNNISKKNSDNRDFNGNNRNRNKPHEKPLGDENLEDDSIGNRPRDFNRNSNRNPNPNHRERNPHHRDRKPNHNHKKPQSESLVGNVLSKIKNIFSVKKTDDRNPENLERKDKETRNPKFGNDRARHQNSNRNPRRQSSDRFASRNQRRGG